MHVWGKPYGYDLFWDILAYGSPEGYAPDFEDYYMQAEGNRTPLEAFLQANTTAVTIDAPNDAYWQALANDVS